MLNLSLIYVFLTEIVYYVADNYVDKKFILLKYIVSGISGSREVTCEHFNPTPYLLVQACQHLWPVHPHGIYQQFTYVTHTIIPSSHPV